MTDDTVPTHLTFNIVEVLLGREYPKTEVPFFLDEASAFALNNAQKRLDTLPIGEDEDEERDALEAEIARLKEKVRATRHVYHLTGLSSKVRGELLEAAYKKFPKEVDPASIFGGEKENAERDEYFGELLLQAMTEKIVSPAGAVMTDITLEQIKQFRDNAPDAAVEAIAIAQRELTEGAKGGFESAAQDTDFSSAP